MIEITLGVTGLLVLMVGFVVEHLHRKRSRLWFNILNVLGSLLLGVYALMTSTIIFIILEFLWAGLSFFYIFRKA